LRLDLQTLIPVSLCTLQNFIQRVDHDEGAIPSNPYQAAYAPFPSDVNEDYGSGFIEEDDTEANAEVKSRRINIAYEMWRSYLDYMADAETSNSDDSVSNLGE
jgi:hypothetical protein